MKTLYCIDVDGTVADNAHRLHLIDRDREGGPDWDAFFSPAQMMLDRPIEAARRHFENGRFIHGPHLFLTARIASARLDTFGWLVRYGFATRETWVICKPDVLRLQRARVFKPSVLAALSKFDYPGHRLVLIEDYGEVRRATADAGFETRHAPDCWDDWQP